ncbi:hypothetical protein M501DRAFT_998408 [Patellaria atrata CBS 101060]|uniref:RanBP2-type domain-containing protein n=1 Tax=Patellaria atrata CBS 101060 TaxID=1346257 RepID=A0A9P4SGV6_9PEZI|nr:hypothetical protein M501DRAFT_998408 [Patellaria atrata CBS 101060]
MGWSCCSNSCSTSNGNDRDTCIKCKHSKCIKCVKDGGSGVECFDGLTEPETGAYYCCTCNYGPMLRETTPLCVNCTHPACARCQEAVLPALLDQQEWSELGGLRICIFAMDLLALETFMN